MVIVENRLKYPYSFGEIKFAKIRSNKKLKPRFTKEKNEKSSPAIIVGFVTNCRALLKNK